MYINSVHQMYTEDFYEIEVVDETAVKKLVNYISNVHQFRPSDEVIKIYKEDRMSSVFIDLSRIPRPQ